MKPVYVSDRLFRRSHGHGPRGHGSWGFIVMDGDREVATFFAPAMNFSDAKVWAKAHARKAYNSRYLSTDLEVAP